MKILFMGTSEFAVPCLSGLLENKFEILGVVTKEDKINARGNRVLFSPVKDFALSKSLKIFQPKKLDEEFLELIKVLNIEALIVVAYGKILPESFLNLAKFGSINVHGSLLPKFRGAAPIQWSIIRGERESGITTMLMEKGLDSGDILMQKATEIRKGESFGELYQRLSYSAPELLLETLKKIEAGELIPRKQNSEEVTWAPPIFRQDAKITWDESAQNIVNLIRGTNPKPGAWTIYNEKEVKIYKAFVSDKRSCNSLPGQIVSVSFGFIEISSKNSEIVCIEELQISGKKRMTAKEFLNGNKIKLGEIIG